MIKQFSVYVTIILAAVSLESLGQDVYGNYLEFNGLPFNTSGNFVDVADDPSLDFDASQSFSIQFWINPKSFNTSANAFQGIVTKKNGNSPGDVGYGVFWNVSAGGDGTIQLLLEDVGGSTASIATPIIPDANALGWTHVTAVLERNSAPATDTAFFYLDGELVSKSSVSIGNLSNSINLQLMNYSGNSTNECSGGSLDEVRIWDVPLTVRQIHRFYNEPIAKNNSTLFNKVIGTFTSKRSFVLNWSDLVGYWDMEETLPSYTITDKSDNSNDGVFYEGSTACNSTPCGPIFRDLADPLRSPKQSYVAVSSGNWSNPTTWSDGNIPNSADAVVYITDGRTVTLDGEFKVEDLNIANNSVLNANSLSVLQVVKYMHIDGSLNCKTNGTVLFDEVGSHWVYGEGTADFFNFTLFQNSQVTIDTENNTPINIYGILEIGDGRLVTRDKAYLKVNKSNASRPYGLVSAIGVGSPDVRGTLIMEKQLSSADPGWRQMCLPLQGSLSDFVGLTLNYNTAPLTEQNVFFWDNAQDDVVAANNAGWTSASSMAGQGQPYSIYLDGGDFSFDPTITFEGEYIFGDTSFNVTYYNDPGNPLTAGTTGYENGVGWNFIPNRYPSLLNVEDMVDDNPLTYPNIHVWDANTQQYVSFLSGNSATVIPYNNDPAVAAANSSFNGIEPFQGFWVKTTDLTEAGSTPFVLKDSYRSVFFNLVNVAPTLKTTNHLQLNIFSASDSTWDGLSVAFDESVTTQFNPKKESYKLFSPGNVPSIYTVKDKRWLTSMVCKPSSQEVTVGFRAKKEDASHIYHLNLDIENMSDPKHVILEDLATGVLHDFEKGDYSFQGNQGFSDQRFKLHFIDPNVPFFGLNNLENLNAYTAFDQLIIQSNGLSGEASLLIMDVTGRMLLSTKVELGQDVAIDAPRVTGIVLVQIESMHGVRTVKVNLRK